LLPDRHLMTPSPSILHRTDTAVLAPTLDRQRPRLRRHATVARRRIYSCPATCAPLIRPNTNIHKAVWKHRRKRARPQQLLRAFITDIIADVDEAVPRTS
jgi:hypothetical protein